MGSKWTAMRGEATTAINMHRNTGNITGMSKWKGSRKCLFCNNDAKTIEHMIPKGKGGNLTKYNCVPVCRDHDKPGLKHWREHYDKQQQELILEHMDGSENNCLNPYYEENKKLAEVLRKDIAKFLNQWAITTA